MSCYLAVRNNGVSIPPFKDREIAFLMPGSIDDVQIDYSGTYIPNVMFECIKMNPQWLVHAQLGNMFGKVKGDFKNTFRQMTLHKTFNVPTAAFAFENSLSDAQRNDLQSMGLHVDPTMQNTYVGSPPPASLTAIYNMSPIEKRLPPGHISHGSYLAYTYLLKAFCMYSSSARYSLAGPNHYIVQSGGGCDVGSDVMIPRLGQSDPKQKMPNAYADGSGDHTIVGSVTPVFIAWDVSKQIHGEFMDASDTSVIPDNANGLFFPYFDGMVLPDKTFINHLFATTFFRSLGNNAEEASEMWSDLRKGIRGLAFTSAGRCLSHLFKGVQLSMNSKTTITAVLYRGVYVGFVLGGTCEFLMWGKEYKSVNGVSLRKQIGETNKQDRLRGELVALLNAPVKIDGMPWYNFGLADISTSRLLKQTWDSVDENLYGSTEIGDIVSKVDELIFDDQYAPVTQQNVILFLRYIHSGEVSTLKDFPVYLRNGYFIKRGRVSRGLSIFGPTAPSVNYGSASDSLVFTLPSRETANDPNLAVHDNVRALRFLPVSIRPIREAEDHWNSCLKHGTIRIPKGRKNREEFTNTTTFNLRIATAPYFDEAYRLIKETSADIRESLRSGKRARVDDDDQSGPSNKRKKSANNSKRLAGMI